MKLIYFLILFIFSNKLIAQNVSSIVNKQNIYVYNDLKDTIHLTEISTRGFCFCDTLKIFDTIQIDGFGSKEIVLFRNCNGFIDEHGGLFDITESFTISKYEIWNLDTKQMIFEAINFYKSYFDRFLAFNDPSHIRGMEFYSYDFKIDSVGQINISNLMTDTEAFKVMWKTIKKSGKRKTIVEEVPYNYDFLPDKKAGFYRYVNGKYFNE